MSETFTNKLTIKGQQKKAVAEANNTGLNITTFQVGDGNGAYYEPTENQTALKNTKYTGTFTAGTQSQILVNSSATNEVLYKCFIPADVGGFTIRELGLFDNDGDLILICKLPAQDKFSLSSGLYQPLTFTPKIIYTNPTTSAVLTPTSQIVPTTSEVTNMIQTSVTQMETVVTELQTTVTQQIENITASVNTSINQSVFPRFTVNASQINSSTGQPNFLSGSGTSTLTLNASAANPLIASFANGTLKTLTANLTADMTGLTGTFLIRLNNYNSPALSVYTPSYVFIQPTAPASTINYKWLDTSVKPFVWKTYNGTAWVKETDTPAYSDVLLGVVTVASGTITNIIHYPLNHNFVDDFNNDSIALGTVSSGAISLIPNMKMGFTCSASTTFTIAEIPKGQDVNIQLDVKVSSSSLSFTWSKTIYWMFASAPALSDTTQTYSILLTYKPITDTWEGRWSSKTL